MQVSQNSICSLRESIDFRILLALETTSDCMTIPNMTTKMVFLCQRCQNSDPWFRKKQFCDASIRTVKSAFLQVVVHKNTSRRTSLDFVCLEKTAVKSGCFN